LAHAAPMTELDSPEIFFIDFTKQRLKHRVRQYEF